MDMKKHFKSWAAVLLFVVIVLNLSACNSNKNEATTPAGSTSAASEKPSVPPVVKILMIKSTNFPEENAVINVIRQKTGVNLQVIAVDEPDYENKLNTMIASNDAPDIFISLKQSKAKIKELVDNKVILALDDLLQASGKNILENKGEFLKGAGYIDGKTYAIPTAYVYGNGLALRQDWLDKLNLKVPTTLDEYKTVLEAFVNKDPDGNNKKDTIGLGLTVKADQTFEHVFAAYGVPMKSGVLVDGKVTPWALAPGYLDGVKYFNQLYKEGLIDTDFATIANLQEFEKLWNGKMGAFQFNPPGTTQNWMTRYVEDPKPTFVYTIVKGPNGQGGNVPYVREDIGPWTHISSKSKNPEAALKVLDFLVSEEGNRLTWAGIEGKQYTMKDGKVEWIKPFDDAVQLRAEGGFAYSGIIQRINGTEYQLMNDTTRKGIDLSVNNPIPSAYIFGVPAIEREKKKVMEDMELEFRTSAIVSKGDLDKMYADFKKKYLTEGGEVWIEQATEIYTKEQVELKK